MCRHFPWVVVWFPPASTILGYFYSISLIILISSKLFRFSKSTRQGQEKSTPTIHKYTFNCIYGNKCSNIFKSITLSFWWISCIQRTQKSISITKQTIFWMRFAMQLNIFSLNSWYAWMDGSICVCHICIQRNL